MTNEVLKPSIQMWTYAKGDITVDGVMSAIADRMGGFHISYTANEILKDLGFVTKNGNINIDAKKFLCGELHERFHRGIGRYAVVDPTKTNKELL